jgi:hypothetical protein
MTEKDRRILDDDMDMIKGNLNRMCVCDTIKELEEMYNFAAKRLFRIYRINLERLIDKAESEE